MSDAYALRDVRVVLGGRPVLAVPALQLAAGAMTALVGANGAGKSTLLRLLAFLLPPAAGAVEFAGTPVAWSARPLAALRRRVTYVASAPYLFRGTVPDNVGYGLRVRRRHDAAAVDAALAAVGLTALAGRPARTLSSGEAQRVALARALVIRPEVLLFDEPTANLDRDSVPRIEAVLAALPERGCTVVLATHDRAQAERLAGRVVRLEDGQVEIP